MDYLSSTKTLFVGTNQKNVLTINIEELLQEGGFEHLYNRLDESAGKGHHLGQYQSSPQALEESGTIPEEDLDAILRGRQAMLDKMNLEDDDPLKKIMSNHDMIVKKHVGGK